MVQTAMWPDDDSQDDYESSLDSYHCPHLECEGLDMCECECEDCDDENCMCNGWEDYELSSS